MSQDKINNTLEELQEELSKTKSANKLVSESKEISDRIIKKSEKTMNDLIEKTQQSTDSAIKEAKKLSDNSKKLTNATDTLTKKLEKVDFPTRLDKIDTNLANNVALINTIGSEVKDNKKLLSSKISKLEKAQKIQDKKLEEVRSFIIGSIGLGAIILAYLIYLFQIV